MARLNVNLCEAYDSKDYLHTIVLLILIYLLNLAKITLCLSIHSNNIN